jgi:hypothetical protein
MKMASFIRADLLPCAGLVLPPILWAVNTQAGQILPYVECGGHRYAAIASLGFALISLAAGFLSWRTVRRNPTDATLEVSAYPKSFSFIGPLSGLNAVLFAFALTMQGVGLLVLTGCER